MGEKLLKRLTGMNCAEAREYEAPRVISRDQVFGDPRVPVRGVRLAAGHYVGVADLEPERERILKGVQRVLYPSLPKRIIDNLKRYFSR